jgi:hypothetical protein
MSGTSRLTSAPASFQTPSFSPTAAKCLSRQDGRPAQRPSIGVGCSPPVVRIARATAVVDRKRARLLTVGERHQKLSQLHARPMLGNQPLHAVTPAPPARLAGDLKRRRARQPKVNALSRGIADALLPGAKVGRQQQACQACNAKRNCSKMRNLRIAIHEGRRRAP